MSEASDSELRDASRRTRSLLSSAFCPAAKRVPTLAVLLVGEVRTLTLPHVYWSIAQHAIDAPGADAKLFMDLKRGLYEGHEPTMQKVNRQSTATVALERALKVLQPAGIRIDHADSSLGPHLMRPDCTVDHGHRHSSRRYVRGMNSVLNFLRILEFSESRSKFRSAGLDRGRGGTPAHDS